MAFFRNILLGLLIGICTAPSWPLAEYHFGFSTKTSSNSKLASYYILKIFEGEVIDSEFLTKEQFVQQASGAINSKANPARIDHFIVNGLEDRCVALADHYKEMKFDCNIIDDIWRLRFDEFPLQAKVQPEDPNGWSTGAYVPSKRQQEILFQYGILSLNEPFVGEEAWRLLRDMSDPSWVAHYRGAP